MMSVTAAPASLLQALMGTDNAAPPEQPGTNAAQFAALIAGAVMPPKSAEIDASALTPEAAPEDQASEDMPTDDGAGPENSEAESDPLAAALAMLPVAMQQAVVAQPIANEAPDGRTQPMPTISPAALTRMLQPRGSASKPEAEESSNPTTQTQASAPEQGGVVLNDTERRAVTDALGATASPTTTTPVLTVIDEQTVKPDAAPPADPKVAAQQVGTPTAPVPPVLAQGQKAVAEAKFGDTPAPVRGSKHKTDAVAARSPDSTDAGTAQSAQPTVQPPAQPIDLSGAPQPKADAQTPIAHALAQQHLKISSDGQWLDQLARDIATTADGNGKLSFHLNPEHLGSLTVEVTRGAEGASVRLTADTDAARTILIDAQPKLEAEARAQGVKIAETHVDLGTGSAGQGAAGQGFGQGSLGQGARQQQAHGEPRLRGVRTGELAAGVTMNTDAAGRRAAAERYA